MKPWDVQTALGETYSLAEVFLKPATRASSAKPEKANAPKGLQVRVAIGAGALLKQRLLFGTLRLEPEEIRSEGSGQLLGRVIESEAVESLALSGGFQALIAAIEICISGAVLVSGAGGWAPSPKKPELPLMEWTVRKTLLIASSSPLRRYSSMRTASSRKASISTT